MLSVHKTESEIQLIESKPKRSEQRALLLEKLRLKGNYKHNCSVIKCGSGEIIPVRSPSSPVDPADYVPCLFCLGFFFKKELWRHCKTCKFATKKERRLSRRGRKVISQSMMLLPSEAGCSEGLKNNIFASMNPDDITFLASRDPVIISFGEKLYQKHGHKKHKHQYIKQKIRELSRFLSVARHECSEISGMEDVIHPQKFPLAIKCVKSLCGYDSMCNSFKTPSLALKIGHSLKACADILRNKGLMSNDDVLEKKATQFHTLCDSDWSCYVSAAAPATLETQKQNKPHVLPLTDDVRVVTVYLKKERLECLNALKSHPDVKTWHALAKACLANIILFNRRRSGEASRILIKDYKEGISRTVSQDDVMLSLSDLEKHLVNNFTRIEVDGKRGKKVPILLTSTMCSEIDELLKTRDGVGIAEGNPYIFSQPFFASESHMAGHSCLREAVVSSQAKEPSSLTSTKLRKHIATVSQILNLTDHELDQVCSFMGHDVRVHREYYRLPEDTLQLAKVSRLLIAMDGGKIAEFKGKPLENVAVDFEVDELEESDNADTVEKESSDESETEQAATEVFLPEDDEPFLKKRKVVDTSQKNMKAFVGRDLLTSAQLDLIRKHFQCQIISQKVPRKSECELFLRCTPLLAGKSWSKVKCTVRNEIEKRKREIRKRKAENTLF